MSKYNGGLTAAAAGVEIISTRSLNERGMTSWPLKGTQSLEELAAKEVEAHAGKVRVDDEPSPRLGAILGGSRRTAPSSPPSTGRAEAPCPTSRSLSRESAARCPCGGSAPSKEETGNRAGGVRGSLESSGRTPAYERFLEAK